MSSELQKPKQKNVDGTTIQVGMPLVDEEGNFIGIVKEIQEQGFLVDRSQMRFQDLFIPYWVCLDDGPGQICLQIRQEEINQTIWRTPDP